MSAQPLLLDIDTIYGARDASPEDMSQVAQFRSFLMSTEPCKAGIACWTDAALEWLGVPLEGIQRRDGVVVNLRQPGSAR